MLARTPGNTAPTSQPPVQLLPAGQRCVWVRGGNSQLHLLVTKLRPPFCILDFWKLQFERFTNYSAAGHSVEMIVGGLKWEMYHFHPFLHWEPYCTLVSTFVNTILGTRISFQPFPPRNYWDQRLCPPSISNYPGLVLRLSILQALICSSDKKI